MCEALAASVHLVSEAVDLLGSDSEAATDKANEALRAAANREGLSDAMASVVGIEDLREVMSRRALYRRVARIGEVVVDVAERVWYTVVKEA